MWLTRLSALLTLAGASPFLNARQDAPPRIICLDATVTFELLDSNREFTSQHQPERNLDLEKYPLKRF